MEVFSKKEIAEMISRQYVAPSYIMEKFIEKLCEQPDYVFLSEFKTITGCELLRIMNDQFVVLYS